MINLDNYFAMHPASVSGENSVYWMILKYFKSHRDATFPTQSSLCAALKKEFNLGKSENICTQSAVSKALKNIQPQDIQIGNEVFVLLKNEKCYRLQKKDLGKISDLVDIGDIFEKEQVYKLSANTLVLSFKKGGAEKFKKELHKIYPEDVFFKLLICDNTLFMMFNEHNSCFSENFSQITNFFTKRKEFLDQFGTEIKR